MTTYYVDTASSGGDGTTTATSGENAAFATVAAVNAASFSGDDQILFKRGCTWREQLTVPSSGSDGSPITFGAYGSGSKPKITGSDLKSSWTSAALTGNTNLLANPEAFNSWNAPTRATISANVATPLSPAATQTVDGLIPSVDNNTHIVDVGASVSQSTAYTFSVYVKPGASNWVRLDILWFNSSWEYLDGSGSYYYIAPYGVGAVGTTHWNDTSTAIYDVGNGWYRIVLIDSSPAGGVNALPEISCATADNVQSFAGDGSSVYTYMWGAKFEAASAPSIYSNYTAYYATSATVNLIVTDDGTRMLRSLDASIQLYPNQFTWVDATDRLYVRLTAEADPDGSVIEAYNRQVAAEAIGKSWITFDGLEFTGTQSTTLAGSDIRETGAGLSIEIPAADATYQGFVVQNCTFTKNGNHGALFWMEWIEATGGRTATNITFSNNIINEGNWELNTLNNSSLIRFYGRPSDSFWEGVTISGNTLYQDIAINPINDGGFFTSGMWLDVTGGSILVTQNDVSGCSHGITVYGESNTSDIGSYTRNYIHDTADDCFWLVGPFAAANVSYNKCYNPLDQFLDTYRSTAAADQQSGLVIANNTVHTTANAGINLVKCASATVKNNIFYNVATSNGLSQQYHYLYINDQVNGNTNTTLGTLVADYNDVYIPAGALVGVYNSVESESYAWADWKSEKSQDAHSLNADPLFVNAAGGDFRLQPTSTCIDSGTAIDGIHTAGNTDVDIGALERKCVKEGLPGKLIFDYPPINGAITGGDYSGNTHIYNCR